MPREIEDYQNTITELSEVDENLTEWEIRFVSDYVERFEKYGLQTFVSDAQAATIEKIWNRCCG